MTDWSRELTPVPWSPSPFCSTADLETVEASGITWLHAFPDGPDGAKASSGAGAEVRLLAPQQEAVFYFRAAQAGAVTVSVTGDGVSASQAQTVE